MDIYALAQQCSPHIQEKQVVAAIVHTESKYNPYAIGVVGTSIRQPRNLTEAILAVRALRKNGNDFSVGLAQVNQSNFAKYGLNESNMFDPCSNIKAGMSIYKWCFDEAGRRFGSQYSYDGKLRLAASCYYSGNFKTGFTADFPNQPPYVTKFYTKLQEYRGANRNRSAPIVIQPVVPIPTTPQAPMQATAQSANNEKAEYEAIVNAIKLQNTQLTTKDNEPKQTEPSLDTTEKTERKFNGDLFATPMNQDVFSKRV